MKINRILVIDDEPRVSDMVKFALGGRGPFHVREENDFTHAAATARSYRPDVIVFDVDPPWDESCDAARQFDSDPVLRAVPVVRLSALESEKAAAHLSGVLFISKPVDPNCLMDVIARALTPQTALCALS